MTWVLWTNIIHQIYSLNNEGGEGGWALTVRYYHFSVVVNLFWFLFASRLRLTGATALCYALKMLQRVFRYCANEYKMDVNGKFGLLFSLFSGVYAYSSKFGECSVT